MGGPLRHCTFASSKGLIGVVKQLLRYGADVRLRGTGNQSLVPGGVHPETFQGCGVAVKEQRGMAVGYNNSPLRKYLFVALPSQ